MKDTQEEKQQRHSIGFAVSGKKREEPQLLKESDNKQKEIEDRLKSQGTKVVEVKRVIDKKRFSNNIKISTILYYESPSSEKAFDEILRFAGFDSDNTRQALKEAAEDGTLEKSFNEGLDRIFNPDDKPKH